jgi:hypothetical protein
MYGRDRNGRRGLTFGRQANKYLTTCTGCGRTTSKKYAATSGGLCKFCKTGTPRPEPQAEAEARDRRRERDAACLIDSGYQAYAAENGHFDGPDY